MTYNMANSPLTGHFPGNSSGPPQGSHPPAVTGQVQGNASGQPQGSGAPDTDPGPVNNKRLRKVVGGLMQALAMTIDHRPRVQYTPGPIGNVARSRQDGGQVDQRGESLSTKLSSQTTDYS